MLLNNTPHLSPLVMLAEAAGRDSAAHLTRQISDLIWNKVVFYVFQDLHSEYWLPVLGLQAFYLFMVIKPRLLTNAIHKLVLEFLFRSFCSDLCKSLKKYVITLK